MGAFQSVEVLNYTDYGNIGTTYSPLFSNMCERTTTISRPNIVVANSIKAVADLEKEFAIKYLRRWYQMKQKQRLNLILCLILLPTMFLLYGCNSKEVKIKVFENGLNSEQKQH